MPYHVEIKRSFQRAWAFNLDERALRDGLVEPWLRGAVVRMGERDWLPRESSLKILEGPRLEPPDLAHGQGWNHAERTALDVTRDLLERARSAGAGVALLASDDSTHAAAADLLAQLGVQVLDWRGLRARLLSGRDADGGTAVLAVAGRAAVTGGWLFDAGLAKGALGARAVVAWLGSGAPPDEVAELDPLVLEPANARTSAALAERLRQVGAGAPRS
jgi:hypothetical protein